MDLGNKRALAVKKVTALQIKFDSLSASSVKVRTKRKYLGEGDRPLKRTAHPLTGIGEGSS